MSPTLSVEHPSQESVVDPLIRVQGLTKSFGAKPVLCGVDLEIPRGQIFGYIGPNGAGKTTTVRILCGMLDGFGGSATVCGHDVAREPLDVKRHLGYVPESGALYDALTPLEYLQFVGRLYGLPLGEISRRAVKLLGLFGLSAEVEQRLSTFSKGMRQKVLIVAGLLHDPELVFMDEPLAGLDANSVVIVKEVMTRLAAAGKTIFYCSHVMDVVERICHRIAIINEGRIIADGSFHELQAMNKAASLERIFTDLTSAGGHAVVADQFLRALQTAPADND
jgi:ABC-2 type transport system ATP-binding protein